MGYFSNGTEGESYYEQHCAKCIHAKPDDGGCVVWLLHLLYSYRDCNEKDSMLHVLIPRSEDGLSNEQCKMFADKTGIIHSDLLPDFLPTNSCATHCHKCGMPYHGVGACAVAVSDSHG